MPRSVGDTWDIVTSVGATALAVATLRAVETRKPEPLARDDCAQYFVSATATQAPSFSKLLSDPELATQGDVALFSSYVGARTKYFDDHFLAAGATGIRQAVIVAAGLDVRGYRLAWAPGTTVYELDLPKVLEFKGEVLHEHEVTETATVRALSVDLRDDWPAVLTAAGFDRTRPTAWLAEGLLPFLPATAQDLLFERISQLSAPGSRFAVEDFAQPHEHSPQLSDAMPEGGAVRRMFESFLDEGADESSLWFDGDRVDPVMSLSQQGWSVDATTARNLLVQYGRADLVGAYDPTDVMGSARYFTAVLS